MNPQISDFSEKEKTWLAISIARGREMCLALTGHRHGPVTAENLDRIFQAWAALPEKNRASHEDVANGLGCLFGELLKADFGFVWQMIDDHYGREAAVIDEKTGSVVFPVNTVWKRIEPTLDSKDFFRPMWESVKKHLEKATTGHGNR